MKYKETTKSLIPLEDHHILYDIQETDSTIIYYVKSKKHLCHCPHCNHKTTEQVSTYTRIVQDIPQYLKRTDIHYIVSRYKCSNCGRIFSETLRDVKKNQVRTKRLTQFILGLSIHMSDYNTSRALKYAGAVISHDTVKRIIEGVKVPDETEILRIGIDEIALKKGQTYVTVIYDLKDGHLIAILKGRDEKTVADWLKKHPEIELITRDRSKIYTRAISFALPQAVQITDRFHLLQNATHCLKKILYKEIPEKIDLKELGLTETPKKADRDSPETEEITSLLNYDSSAPLDENGKPVVFDDSLLNPKKKLAKEQAKNRKEKQKLIRKVKTFYSEQECSLKQLAQEFSLSLPTVKKYLEMSKEDVAALDHPRRKRRRKSSRTGYVNIIYKMLLDGHPISVIHQYILAVTDNSISSEQVYGWIAVVRDKNFDYYIPRYSENSSACCYSKDLLTRYKIFSLLLQSGTLSEKDQKIKDYLFENFKSPSFVSQAYSEFYQVIMGKEEIALKEFLKKYKETELNSFCKGLEQDYPAITNAIVRSESNGLTEGNNCKAKCIKRILYGRAGLVKFEIKAKLAFFSNKAGFDISTFLQ